MAEKNDKLIMVVDDNPDFLNLMELLLGNAGYRVQPAEGAAEAMALMENTLPDAILLDIMMPNRNGFEFLENLRWDARFEKIPVIVMTAMTLDREEQEFLEAFGVTSLNKAKAPEVVGHLMQQFGTQEEG